MESALRILPTLSAKGHMMPEELAVREIKNNVFDFAYRMDAITVDGIYGVRGVHIHSNYLLSVKSDEDEFGNVTDAGKPMTWSAKYIINERHWLVCNTLTPMGAQCLVCGERV